jgi:hypothetical protein
MYRAWILRNSLGDSIGSEISHYEPDANAGKIQNEIENGLIECDALVVLYGEVGLSWVVGQLRQFRKLVPNRTKDPRLLAVATASKEAKALIPSVCQE